MFGPLVLHRVAGQVSGRDVVTVDDRRRRGELMEFGKELVEPNSLGNTVGDGTVLGLGAGPGDGVLALGGP